MDPTEMVHMTKNHLNFAKSLPLLRPFLMGLLLCSSLSAQAQTYPSKPIRVIVPWPAGGLVDVAARHLSNRLQTAMGQPIVIENKLGAGGNVGADQASKAAADGYTLLFTSSALSMSTALRNKMPFDAIKDLERVAVVAYAPSVLVVSQNSNITSVQDLIKVARDNPGKLSYASAGVGSPAHLTGELFKSRQNLFILHIPYTGAPAAMTDQIAGRIDYHFSNAAVALPQIKAGKVRALAVPVRSACQVCPMYLPWQKQVSKNLKPINGWACLYPKVRPLQSLKNGLQKPTRFWRKMTLTKALLTLA